MTNSTVLLAAAAWVAGFLASATVMVAIGTGIGWLLAGGFYGLGRSL